MLISNIDRKNMKLGTIEKIGLLELLSPAIRAWIISAT